MSEIAAPWRTVLESNSRGWAGETHRKYVCTTTGGGTGVRWHAVTSRLDSSIGRYARSSRPPPRRPLPKGRLPLLQCSRHSWSPQRARAGPARLSSVEDRLALSHTHARVPCLNERKGGGRAAGGERGQLPRGSVDLPPPLKRRAPCWPGQLTLASQASRRGPVQNIPLPQCGLLRAAFLERFPERGSESLPRPPNGTRSVARCGTLAVGRAWQETPALPMWLALGVHSAAPDSNGPSRLRRGISEMTVVDRCLDTPAAGIGRIERRPMVNKDILGVVEPTAIAGHPLPRGCHSVVAHGHRGEGPFEQLRRRRCERTAGWRRGNAHRRALFSLAGGGGTRSRPPK